MSDMPKTMPTKPKKLSDVPGWDFETDVAVVGFGGAGSCAAIEASDGGADATFFGRMAGKSAVAAPSRD